MASREELETLEKAAQGVAQLVGPAFEAAGAAFAVLGFSFGEGGWSTWVSNAHRPDMIRALREMADKLERDEDIPAMPVGTARA